MDTQPNELFESTKSYSLENKIRDKISEIDEYFKSHSGTFLDKNEFNSLKDLMDELLFLFILYSKKELNSLSYIEKEKPELSPKIQNLQFLESKLKNSLTSIIVLLQEKDMSMTDGTGKVDFCLWENQYSKLESLKIDLIQEYFYRETGALD